MAVLDELVAGGARGVGHRGGLAHRRSEIRKENVVFSPTVGKIMIVLLNLVFSIYKMKSFVAGVVANLAS